MQSRRKGSVGFELYICADRVHFVLPQAKVYRRIARSIKTAKQMALAPIDTRPSLSPQGTLRQQRPARGPPAQGGQQRGASGFSAPAPPASTAAPAAGLSTEDEDIV